MILFYNSPNLKTNSPFVQKIQIQLQHIWKSNKIVSPLKSQPQGFLCKWNRLERVKHWILGMTSLLRPYIGVRHQTNLQWIYEHGIWRLRRPCGFRRTSIGEEPSSPYVDFRVFQMMEAKREGEGIFFLNGFKKQFWNIC